MARVKGYYINLEGSRNRRERIQRHIDEEGLSDSYQRYEAIDGTKCDPRGRNLTSGELGLWETWISLLEKETLSNDYEFLHVMEDDCVISKEFKDFCTQLPDSPLGSDLIMTEMYVNPSAYRCLVGEHERLKREKKIKIVSSNYTGCISSALIHKSRINTILQQLRLEYQNIEGVLPLDNQLRKLDQQGRLKVSRVAPFITSIVIEDIKKTTIQDHVDNEIADSQVFCALLRRKLSTLDDKETTKALAEVFLQVVASTKKIKRQNIENELVKSIVNIAYQEKVLRYRWHSRLREEKDNKQYLED